MRTLLRFRWWKVEASLFRYTSIASSASLAFLAIAAATYGMTVHIKSERAALCLAENLYHEGRGETRAARYQLGMIVLARVADPRWPKTVCGVIAQDRQFSWVLDYRLATTRNERARWEENVQIARDLLDGVGTRYVMPAGWECVRWYKRTDGRGVSRKGKHFFETKLFPVGTFGHHTAFQERRGCAYP